MEEKKIPLVSISIVSHGQMNLVNDLLTDIELYCQGFSYEVLLTLNIDEPMHANIADITDKLTVIRNAVPKGFGANHNQAFQRVAGEYFCVLNPDIRLRNNPFPELIDGIAQHKLGVCAPMVLNPAGSVEDSARRFPTPFQLISKALGFRAAQSYPMTGRLIHPDWVGGMFMLFPSSIYRKICGFDESYFLYYEDVDICARLYLNAMNVGLLPDVHVVHMAQRASHKNRRYFVMHIQSIVNFFFSWRYVRLRWKKLSSAAESLQ